VVTLFFAGFETTARSLTWAWYLLGRHPEALAELEQEADRVLAGRPVTDADLPGLRYTRMVVDETLRLYPPTALLARQPVEEDEIGGYRIPPGALIVLVPHLVHRDPAVWEDAERFDPERFVPDAVAKRPKAAYIPFASGPRVCLGNSFALQEMVIALAMAAARFHLQPADGAPIDYVFRGTTRPTRPLVMAVARR
jgi:cytochrome P450